ncbi:MAG: acyltransferase [Kiritimatiellae bacterium]|nr:acyltransferase [Kiritimatiellia bacterium]
MKERNSGVDLAKAVAIFLVVLFHVLSVGESVPHAGPGFYLGTYLQAFSSCCVNLFGLTSGYLGVTGHPTFRKWMKLWLQVFVVNALMTGVCHFVFGAPITGIDISHAVLPVTSAAYWYFTAYTGLYCLMPLLNRGIQALDRRQAFASCAGIFAVMSLSASIGARDVYGIISGYSVLWLISLYVFGAVIRLHVLRLPRMRWCILVALMLPVLTLAQEVVLVKCPGLAARLQGRALAGHYISPVVLFVALALFCALLQFRPESGRVRKITAYFSSTAFGIYLFHDQSTFHYGVWGGKFRDWAEYGGNHPLAWCAAVIGIAIVTYLTCSLLERGRQLVMGRISK